MNERFVCIKVDREEHPDVDAIYMDAVQAMTGQGALAAERVSHPRRRAVLGRHLLPAGAAPRAAEWPQVLTAIGAAWNEQREGSARQAGGIVERLRGAAALTPPGEAGHPASLAPRSPRCARSMTRSTAASAARRSSRPPRRSSSCSGAGSARWRCTRCAGWPPAACTTRSAAASPATRSTASGSCRTSRRCSTTTPCSRAPTCTRGSSPARRPSRACAARRSTGRSPSCAGGGRVRLRARRRLRGRGGKFYVWTPAEVREALGDELGAEAIEHFGMTEQGNFEGANIPVRRDARPAAPRRAPPAAHEARAKRVWPGLDDKRLTSGTR